MSSLTSVLLSTLSKSDWLQMTMTVIQTVLTLLMTLCKHEQNYNCLEDTASYMICQVFMTTRLALYYLTKIPFCSNKSASCRKWIATFACHGVPDVHGFLIDFVFFWEGDKFLVKIFNFLLYADVTMYRESFR